MPVVLEDDMLLPPSLRRQGYHVNGIDTTSSTTTIELTSPRSSVRGHSRGPIVIHEDHYVPVYGEEITREYIVSPAGGSSTYRRGGGSEFGARYSRARSVGPSGYESYESSYSDDYYLEDGSRHGGRRHRHRSPGRHENNHRGRHIAEAGAGAAIAAYGAHELMKHRSQSHHRSTSHHRTSEGSEHPHRARHLAEAGIAAAGLKHSANHRRHRSHSRGRRGSDGAIYDERHPGWNDDNHRDHRRAMHLAEAGLGIAAAGAAKEVYDHRKRAQRRSSSTGSADRHESHNGRHVAAAALGATAAGLAHHKMQHHNERRSSSVSSYSSDEEQRSNHRGRKVAGAAIGAAAAGVAGKALYDHYYRRSRSRSRSRSSSSSDEGRRKHHSKLPAAALGTAAALAAKHHYDHKHDNSRSRSRSHSRSRDRHNGPGVVGKAGYMMAGALAEKHHRKKHHEREQKRSMSVDGHRERRHRRDSESSGHYSKHSRSRRGSLAGAGGIMSNMMGGARGHGEAPPREKGLGEKVAYKLGELAAEEIAARRLFGKDKERR